jgi:hypothetical protein
MKQGVITPLSSEWLVVWQESATTTIHSTVEAATLLEAACIAYFQCAKDKKNPRQLLSVSREIYRSEPREQPK